MNKAKRFAKHTAVQSYQSYSLRLFVIVCWHRGAVIASNGDQQQKSYIAQLLTARTAVKIHSCLDTTFSQYAETGEVQEFLSRAKLSRASRLKYEYLSAVVLYIKNESVS